MYADQHTNVIKVRFTNKEIPPNQTADETFDESTTSKSPKRKL